MTTISGGWGNMPQVIWRDDDDMPEIVPVKKNLRSRVVSSNCRNCGAPIGYKYGKCEYCGTYCSCS